MSYDVVLIHPGAAHGIYGELGDTLTAVEPPVWCRIIAGYLRDRGWAVKIIDAEAMGFDPPHVGFLVQQMAPRLACLCVYGHQPSASTQQMYAAGLTASAIKARCEVPVMMLGGHVSALPKRTMEEEDVDFICVGEGPVTIDELLRFGSGYAISGLGWKSIDGQMKINPSAPLIEDMARLHGDAWDLLPMTRYRSHNWQAFGDLASRQPYASIHTSLGCPWRCHFCCINAPFATNRYRMRNPESVLEEMMMLRERYGVQTFKIADEMFVLNERHYTAIASHLATEFEADELNIWAYSRIDTVTAANLALLRRAGVRWLALGIESASAHVRDGSTKAMRTSDIVGVVRAVQSAGINVIGNYIFGLPDDDMSTMQATLDLALELKTEFANFYSAMAYPGSPLYDRALREGRKLPATWRGYSQHNDDCRPLDTDHVSGADVLRFRDAAFDRYFTDPGYLEMVDRQFGAATVEHVRSMTGYKLRRKLLEPGPAAA